MTRPMRGLSAALLAVCTALPIAAAAELSYPSRPIELVVPWGAGGGADQLARKAAQLLEPKLGVSVPALNLPGASGVTGLQKMLAAPADGYTLSVLIADTTALLAGGPQPWSTKDFQPLGILIRQPSMLFVAAASPFQSWAEVKSAAASRELKVGVTGIGTQDDIAVGYLIERGLKLNAVPYAKAGERYAALLGGHVDLLYEQAGDIRAMLESNQARPILALAAERVAGFPDTASSREEGYDLVLDQWRAIIVRQGTPAEAVQRLERELRDVAGSAEWQRWLAEQHADPQSVITGPEAAAFIDRDVDALKRFASP